MTLVTNALVDGPDEGTLRLATELAKLCRAEGIDVIPLTGDDGVLARKLLLDRRLLRHRGLRRKSRPVVYLPTQSLTTGTVLRAKLARLLTGAPVAVIATQPRPSTPIKHQPVFSLHPDGPGTFLPMGVDVERFGPVEPVERRRLRAAHAVPDHDRPVVLHVGHLSPNRNLDVLARLARTGDATVVVVGSRRFGVDPGTEAVLADAGALVRTGYIERITELYQLADVYAFPVVSGEGAIGTPLSVLEAMACNLPVATTPFGGLPRMFDAEAVKGLQFARTDDELVDAVFDLAALPAGAVATRDAVARYAWPEALKPVLELLR
jgi:glycosyltransferase involved in cell wall biosynthesis